MLANFFSGVPAVITVKQTHKTDAKESATRRVINITVDAKIRRH